jgi:hypothetical protein
MRQLMVDGVELTTKFIGAQHKMGRFTNGWLCWLKAEYTEQNMAIMRAAAHGS